MVILHYIPSIDRTAGGVASYMKLLAKELGRLVELHVVTHASQEELELENCCVHRIPVVRWFPWYSKRDFVHLLDVVKPDVVHVNCCWEPLCSMVVSWAKQKNYPVVYTPHGMLEPWILQRHPYTKKLPALILYQKKALKLADMLHATARSEKDNLLALGLQTPVEIVANAVDVQAVTVKASWKPRKQLLFLARIHVKKGLEMLIEAVALLRDRLADYHIVIAGEGEKRYLSDLKQLAQEKGVATLLQFVGGVYGDRKWQLYRESDCFVLPTFSENFGIVIAEALASGTPVITTQGTPWYELAEGGGWWIPAKIESLVAALEEMVQLDEQQLEHMGRQGRKLVEEKYDTRSVAKQMGELYGRLLCAEQVAERTDTEQGRDRRTWNE